MPSKVKIDLKLVVSSLPQPPKGKTDKSQSFKTTAPSQSINCPKSVTSRPPHSPMVEIIQNPCLQNHILPKWKLSKISPFKTQHIFPKWKCLKISPIRTSAPSQSGTCKNQSFQDNIPSWSNNCLKPVKTTTSFESGNSSKLVLWRSPTFPR